MRKRRISGMIAAALIVGMAAPGSGERPKRVFRIGERFKYGIHWGILNVGSSVIEVKGIEEVDGHPCYHVVARTRSNAVIAAFYPVDDTVETFIDVEGLFSRKFIKKLNEGNYHADEETIFDVDRGIAYWKSHRNGKTKEYGIPPEPQDVLSLMYWLRGQDLKPNSKYKFQVCADEKVYTVEMESRGRKKVRLARKAGGKQTAIEVEPVKAEFQGMFVRKGRIVIWVSDDEKHYLLRMIGKIPVASIKMILQEVREGDEQEGAAP